MQKRRKVIAVCVNCQRKFMAAISEIKKGKGRCCSLSCAAALAAINRDQKNAANNNWKGGISNQSNTEKKRRYREKYPEKYKAHLMLRNAIRNGILNPEPCEVCGCIEVEGHHDDYALPLSVRWLCKKHHIDAHKVKLL